MPAVIGSAYVTVCGEPLAAGAFSTTGAPPSMTIVMLATLADTYAGRRRVAAVAAVRAGQVNENAALVAPTGAEVGAGEDAGAGVAVAGAGVNWGADAPPPPPPPQSTSAKAGKRPH